MCYIVNLKNLDRCYWKAYQILEKKSGDYFVLRLWCKLPCMIKKNQDFPSKLIHVHCTSTLRVYTILEINVS